MTVTVCFQGNKRTDVTNSGLATDISDGSASMLSLGKSDQFFRRKDKQSKLAQYVSQCKAREGRTNKKKAHCIVHKLILVFFDSMRNV